MGRQFNKETSGSTIAREHDAASMKNIIVTVVAIVIALLLVSTHNSYNEDKAIEVGNDAGHAYALDAEPEPAPELKVADTPPLDEPPTWDELSLAEKIKQNPQGCDLDAQIMHDDGSCHDKPKPEPETNYPKKPDSSTQHAATGGTYEDWMVAAGIPINYATQKLIVNESGCRTGAVNPSSGACGIPQAHPCSKLPCPLNDSGAVCQLQWMDNYVKGRYGSWGAALAHRNARVPINGKDYGHWY